MRFLSLGATAIILFLACKPAYNIQKTEESVILISDSAHSEIDSTMYSLISPYKEKMDVEMSIIIGESEFAMERGVPESRLGNFVADACFSEAGKIYFPADNHLVDFAFFNTGGLRKPLPKGKISKGDVFELMPFENELVVLSVNGLLVEKIFNFIASKNGAPISGARFLIKEKQALNILIQGKPLDNSKTYKVLTSDYLANGGESYDFLKSVPRESLNLKVRNAILNYLESATALNHIISVSTDGRITNE